MLHMPSPHQTTTPWPGAAREASSVGISLLVAWCVLAGFGLAGTACAEPTEAESKPRRHDDLHVRYAEARVRLAEADLQTALDRNAQVHGLISGNQLARLQARVRVLRAQAEAVREQPHGGSLAAQRARARAAAEVAEEELAAARRFSDNHPDVVGDEKLRRLELLAEVARLRMALWEDPANIPSLIDEMQMQIDQLTDHTIDLLDRSDDPVLPGAR